MSDMHARLQQVFRETFFDDTLELRDALSAKDVPEWDSLAHVSLIVATEREFGVRFAAAEVSALQCVGDLRALLESKLK